MASNLNPIAQALFATSATGTGPDDTSTSYNTIYYASPGATEALANILGATTTSTPNSQTTAPGSPFSSPTANDIVLNGQTSNAGQLLDDLAVLPQGEWASTLSAYGVTPTQSQIQQLSSLVGSNEGTAGAGSSATTQPSTVISSGSVAGVPNANGTISPGIGQGNSASGGGVLQSGNPNNVIGGYVVNNTYTPYGTSTNIPVLSAPTSASQNQANSAAPNTALVPPTAVSIQGTTPPISTGAQPPTVSSRTPSLVSPVQTAGNNYTGNIYQANAPRALTIAAPASNSPGILDRIISALF